MRGLLSLLLMAVSAVGAGAGPYDGRYRPIGPEGDTWDCTSVGEEGGAILLNSSFFFAVGSRCSLRDPVPVVGMDATLYDAICRTDGAPWHRRIMIMRSENGITVVQKGARISKLQSCG
ncbi:MAG: hypothetical protein ABJJ53_11190 [Sulfitobacter sp.]